MFVLCLPFLLTAVFAGPINEYYYQGEYLDGSLREADWAQFKFSQNYQGANGRVSARPRGGLSFLLGSDRILKSPSEPSVFNQLLFYMTQLDWPIFLVDGQHRLSISAYLGAARRSVMEDQWLSTIFRPLITDENDDARLGNCQLMLYDEANSLFLAFMLTNGGLYISQERWAYAENIRNIPNYPFLLAPYSGYQTWFRVGSRKPVDLHNLEIILDGPSQAASFLVEGEEILTVPIGMTSGRRGQDVGLFRSSKFYSNHNQLLAPLNLKLAVGCGQALDRADYHNPSNPISFFQISPYNEVTMPSDWIFSVNDYGFWGYFDELSSTELILLRLAVNYTTV